jgi:lipoyl-dependent peroxiredoxin
MWVLNQSVPNLFQKPSTGSFIFLVIFTRNTKPSILQPNTMKRSATATWSGTGKEGKGTMTTQSGILNTDQYSYKTRFEDGIGTNPEELVAAAHAGCFSMKLSFVLGVAGFTPTSIATKCTVNLEGGAIIESHLDVTAVVPGIDEAKFAECAEEAKATCPISKSLTANITLEARLA